ncbi:histidinol dehydrogenase [Candidatus Vidania fulgoroideorum]
MGAQEIVNRKILRSLERIRTWGDREVRRMCARFDHYTIDKENHILYTDKEKFVGISKSFKIATRLSIKRIANFHNQQKKIYKSWLYRDKEKNIIGQMLSVIQNVAIYIPCGKAVYISTLLMCFITARIAGVKNIYVMSPINYNRNIHFLYTARKLGIRKIYNIGGIQGIGAFAFGTKLFPKVDKIIGPGNYYVNESKKIISSICGIDILAGPSEIVVLTDGYFSALCIAYDAMAQAEHDINAKVHILSDNMQFLYVVRRYLKDMWIKNPRAYILAQSLRNLSIVKVQDISGAIKLINNIAPEHLEIVCNRRVDISLIKNCGSIFIDQHTPEGVCDYCVGCNHVIPTQERARYSSPLGVYSFLKYTNITRLNFTGFRKLAYNAMELSKREGLYAHFKCISKRLVLSNY